jgi:all-trans-8'-apo-beta-carotenal 15,15'-oxygenase
MLPEILAAEAFTAALDAAPFLECCFFFDAIEDSYEITGIEGHIPAWVKGAYFVNGPARFERAGQRYKHWLDGDGMIVSLRFTDQGVHFANRFVQTTKLKEEDAAGRFLYRGFGTAFPGDRTRRNVMLEPPVNVSVYPFAGRLLAFGEQSLPIEMDPITLESKGDYDFNGSISDVSPFAAHAKTDPANGHLLNFGISFSATEPTLNVYEFDATGEMLRRRRHPLKYQHSLHDFGFTPNYVAFYLSPLLMDFSRFVNEGVSVMESLSWEPEKGSRILISHRSSKAAPAFSVEVGSRYCLHVINCHEEDRLLFVDVFEMERPIYGEYQTIPNLFGTAPACRPVRYIIDLDTKALRERIAMDYDKSPDFPAVDATRAGTALNDFWALGIGEFDASGRKFFDELFRGSWSSGNVCDIYRVPRGQYLGGEPVAVFNPANKEQAVIIVQHHMPKEGRAEFLLFDAFDLAGGPIAKLPLKHKIHAGFHSTFDFAE